MDNASFHKRQDIQEAITQAGHILEYLPPYSPDLDLNPIEKKWAQAKAIRRQKRCSVDELFTQNLLIIILLAVSYSLNSPLFKGQKFVTEITRYYGS